MKFEPSSELVLSDLPAFQEWVGNTHSLLHCTVQGLDFSAMPIPWEKLAVSQSTTFLGCQVPLDAELELRRRGAFFFHAPGNLPYQPFRRDLYHWRELTRGYSPERDESVDLAIYQHFSLSRFNPNVQEALWQRVHDHSIDQAMRRLLRFDDNGMSRLRCVGFMGGHSASRKDEYFVKTAETARLLSRNGYFIATGGGPGIMEAANFGAYFGAYTDRDFYNALDRIQQAPHYSDQRYYSQALQVLEEFPDGAPSLAIPTWFYGHEPSNLFGLHIAKYFSNSIREDTLLAVSLYGIVFAPGGAGTTQEIFMDAAQNHYGTFNYYSPMIFLSRRRYEIDTLIFPLLKQLAFGKPYYDLLHLTDDPSDVLDFLIHHPPIRR